MSVDDTLLVEPFCKSANPSSVKMHEKCQQL